MSIKESIINWMTEHPIYAVCVMAAAEFCAIVYIASVYLS